MFRNPFHPQHSLVSEHLAFMLLVVSSYELQGLSVPLLVDEAAECIVFRGTVGPLS